MPNIDVNTIIIANATVVAALGFFIKMWINGVNEKIRNIERRLDGKVGETLCCERRKSMKEDISELSTGTKDDVNEIYSRIRELEMHK